MNIKKLRIKDYNAASNLMWHTFYQFEKNNADERGMEKFRDLVSPISLKMNSFDGYISLYGAYYDNELSGVIGVREKKHIVMLYVDKNRIGEGIGKRLLLYGLKKCDCDEITVNSSDYAIPFYEKFGFSVNGKRTFENGMVYTPMIKIKEL